MAYKALTTVGLDGITLIAPGTLNSECAEACLKLDLIPVPPVSEITWAYLIKAHREAAGLSQRALATKAELQQRTIGLIESGRTPTPQEETLQSIARALGEKFEWASNTLKKIKAKSSSKT